MQFSISSVVAAVAILAGQTLAGCGPGKPDGAVFGRSYGCPNSAGPHSWGCGVSGAVLYHTGPSWIYKPGSSLSSVTITCGDLELQEHCTDSNWGTFTLDCGDNDISVMETVWNSA
ncbi:hypothetical protein E4U21_004319 [Claviceps maximensis]|nr:hypothetical protein E4U21_004319 [Claviceps maximensis]